MHYPLIILIESRQVGSIQRNPYTSSEEDNGVLVKDANICLCLVLCNWISEQKYDEGFKNLQHWLNSRDLKGTNIEDIVKTINDKAQLYTEQQGY